MKANELMIGDWVRLTDPIAEGMQVQVLAIGRFGGITFYDGITDHIEPIPLTTEILEKNGFHKGAYLAAQCYIKEANHIVYSMLLENGDQVVTLVYCNGKNELEVITIGRGVNFDNVRYVHELQHALHLCGIEKDIKL